MHVNDVTINDGSPQRSQVTSITIAFNSVVTLSDSAFQVLTADASAVGLSVTSFIVAARSVVVLTFLDAEGNPLALSDGNYTLVIHADLIRDRVNRPLDGDLDVDDDDLALFDTAYGSVLADAAYLVFFDFDGDGDIDDDDALAFAGRYGTRLAP